MAPLLIFFFCWCMQTNEENDISQTQTAANTYIKLKVSSCQTPTQRSVTHRNTLLSQHTHVGSLQPAPTASETSQPKPMWGLFCVWRYHPTCSGTANPCVSQVVGAWQAQAVQPGLWSTVTKVVQTSGYSHMNMGAHTHTQMFRYPTCLGPDACSSLLPTALPLSLSLAYQFFTV